MSSDPTCHALRRAAASTVGKSVTTDDGVHPRRRPRRPANRARDFAPKSFLDADGLPRVPSALTARRWRSSSTPKVVSPPPSLRAPRGDGAHRGGSDGDAGSGPFGATAEESRSASPGYVSPGRFARATPPSPRRLGQRQKDDARRPLPGRFARGGRSNRSASRLGVGPPFADESIWRHTVGFGERRPWRRHTPSSSSWTRRICSVSPDRLRGTTQLDPGRNAPRLRSLASSTACCRARRSSR